jgi:hypothetical protein
MDGVRQAYVERRYHCGHCRHDGPGWILGQQSPPEFLLQPHDLYPMTQVAFDYWVGILRTHFPAHPLLGRLGTTFLPRLPEEAEAIREAHARAQPVAEMKDQDGARRVDPDLRTANDWVEIMKPGDTLEFRRRDGGSLHFRLDPAGHSANCRDASGRVLAHAAGLDEPTVREAIQRYLSGNTAGCAKTLGKANAGMLARLWSQLIDPS